MCVVGVVVLDFELDVFILVVMLSLEFGQIVKPVVGSIGGLIDFFTYFEVDITRFIVDVFVGGGLTFGILIISALADS